MLILITGGSKNGKSAIAEDIAVSTGLPLFYIATMEPYSKDAYEAIGRHKKMRLGKGFKTVEKYTNIDEIKLPKKCAVLLECIGNLCANEMFSANELDVSDKICTDISKLIERVEIFIAVTSQVDEDGICYETETMKYISELGILNNRLSDLADCVIEAVYGIPLLLKGEKPNCI